MAMKPPYPDKHRVPVLFSPEEAQELDDWQFQHRHRTRTAAIKALMRLGYDASKAAKDWGGAGEGATGRQEQKP